MIDYSNRKWIIVNVSDITDEMINNSIQTNSSSLRTTTDGSQAILKWDGNTPSCFDGITTYNHSEIKSELLKIEWAGE